MGFQLPTSTGEFVYRISKVGTGWFAVLIAWCLVLDTPKKKSPETPDPELPGHSAPTKGHWVGLPHGARVGNCMSTTSQMKNASNYTPVHPTSLT